MGIEFGDVPTPGVALAASAGGGADEIRRRLQRTAGKGVGDIGAVAVGDLAMPFQLNCCAIGPSTRSWPGRREKRDLAVGRDCTDTFI